MEKLKDEQIISFFESNGYKIVGKIKNANAKTLCEKDGYLYQISYSNLKIGKKPSLWGFNNISNLEHNIKNNLLKRGSKATFVSYDVVTKKNRKRILLHFRCECGNYFDKILEDAIYKKHPCCNDCAKKRRGMTRRKSEKSIKLIADAGYKIIGEVGNIKNSDYVEVEDKDGYRGFMCAANIIGDKGMPRFDLRINKKYYVYNVNHYAEFNGVETRCLSLIEKRHTRQSLLFKCSCGEEFVTSVAYFVSGKVVCPKCAKSISSYERMFKEYLDSIGVEYIYQYSLNQCRDVLPLPFDFFILKHGVIVEIDGEWHYKPAHFNQISYEKALKTFEITKRHDGIKNDYCAKNNIPILRIPYTAMKDGSYKRLFQNFIDGVASIG